MGSSDKFLNERCSGLSVGASCVGGRPLDKMRTAFEHPLSNVDIVDHCAEIICMGLGPAGLGDRVTPQR